MSASRWIGSTLTDRYQIKEQLGQDALSVLYKATDSTSNKTVSVRIIAPGSDDLTAFAGRLQSEAATLAALRHPHIARLIDVGRAGDAVYLVQEYVAGETLQTRLRRLQRGGAPLPLPQVLTQAIAISEAVAYAHSHNSIHGAIKPSNIILDAQDRPYLTDFGLARIVAAPQYTPTGATMATALYLPPEHIRGERLDERGDVYALGLTLFEMIAGQPPFQAEKPMSVLMMQLNDPPADLNRLRPDCPAGLKEVVEKALAKDRAQRYQSAAELNAALHQVLSALQASLQAPTIAGGDPLTVTTPPQMSTDRETEATQEAEKQAGETPVALPSPELSEAFTLPEVIIGDRSKRPLLLIGGAVAGGALLLVVGLLVVLFLVSRSDDDGEVAETSRTQPAQAITAAESVTPTLPTPAAAAASPTAPAAPSPTPEPPPASPTPAPPLLGLLSFLDNEQARAGSFQLTLAETDPPPAGSHYELWISDGQEPQLLGAIEPGGGINLAGDGDQNLLALYDRAFITVEPDGRSGNAPSGPVVFESLASPASLEQVRLLVAAAPETPEGKGYLVAADEQARLAQEHAGFLLDSLAANDLAGARLHAEHVINVLVGEQDSAFGDLDGDGLAQNPGDGFGVLAYLAGAKEQAQLATAGEGISQEVKLQAEETIAAIDNALATLDEAVRAAGRALAADSAAEAQPTAESLHQTLEILLNGDPESNEGGLLSAYENALKMGSFLFFAAQDAAASG